MRRALVAVALLGLMAASSTARAQGIDGTPAGIDSNTAKRIVAGRVGPYEVAFHITPRNPGADQVARLQAAVRGPGEAGYSGAVRLRIRAEGEGAPVELEARRDRVGLFSARHLFGAEGQYRIEVGIDGAELAGAVYIGYATHPLAWRADFLTQAAFVLLGVGFVVWARLHFPPSLRPGAIASCS